MTHNRRNFIKIGAAAIGITAIGAWIWLNRFNMPAKTSNPNEIRLYNGEQLGSVNDFIFQNINGYPDINLGNYILNITGLVRNESDFTYDQIVNTHKHYMKVVTLHCVEGWEVTVLWEGVLLKDLLQEAQYSPSAQVLIFYSQDGYTTSLPLSYIINSNIMIAHKINGLSLLKNGGYPFRLVAEGKLGYKWAKWITKIEVSNDTSFRGYWESNGYSNDANWP